MDIKFLHSHLLDYLETKATPKQIAEYLSLCGPSIERVEKKGNDYIYSIEVTTNRIDAFSVYGIAREASAILPRFKIQAKLKKVKMQNSDHIFTKQVKYLEAQVNSKLCPRFTTVLIRDVKIDDSPSWIKERLEAADIRPINNIVDISNYVMLTLGQPVHTFDYDKIKEAKMVLRESKKGEKITTLDEKGFVLSGGDIVIEDGEGRLIDLAGIMGGNLSKVDKSTKNILLFVQTYNPTNIRKTSMALAQRSVAASIFEKGTDPELIVPGILLGIELFKNLTKGVSEREIIDIYPISFKPRGVKTTLDFIQKRLGIKIPKTDVANYLNSLEFKSSWMGNTLEVQVPSFRSKDIEIEEDLVEEVARIYGYHNLPSFLMDGTLRSEPANSIFKFETEVKNTLKGMGGVEVYTLSLVSKEMTGGQSLSLKNPLGDDTAYLRTSLMPSLMEAAKQNIGTYKEFHLFEMANVYLLKSGDLPKEKLMLAEIFSGYEYRKAKGTVEAFLDSLNIRYSIVPRESKGFSAGRSLNILINKTEIGNFGIAEDSDLIYCEFEIEKLMENVQAEKFTNIPRYPPQVEDLTFTLPEKTKVGEVITAIKYINSQINKVELKDIFGNNYTFNIEYQNPEKTLTDKEVEELRKKIISTVKTKFGAQIKD